MMNHITGCGETLSMMKEKDIKEKSVDCIITSPPYWAKRTYENGENELGSEDTPLIYVKRLADFFQSLEPYLKDTANIFVNLGDTYFGSGAGAWNKYLDENGNLTECAKKRKETFLVTKPLQPKIKQDGKMYQNKQLLMIPARFAIEMMDRIGWILRCDIIWEKPNRIPNGVKDRFNNTYEHVYHFVKNPKYYFDLDAVKIKGKNGLMKNPGDVWRIPTQALKNSPHTATFPEKLVRLLMLAGCPKDGVVLDPFLGTGTTWIVAEKEHRNCIGFELNPEYFAYAEERFYKDTCQGSLF